MEVSHPRIALERAGLLAAGTMSRLMMSELDNRSAFEIGDDFTQFAGRRAGSIDPDNGCLALACDVALYDRTITFERPDFVLALVPTTSLCRANLDRCVWRS